MGMTGEEIINEIKPILEELNYPDAVSYLTYNDRGWLEENIRALEQESKTGRWIDDKCSVCGKGIEDLIDSQEWYEYEEPNFCPFCGVKLIETYESGGGRGCR